MLIGILLIFLGVLSFFAAIKGMSINNKVSYVIAVMLCIVGALVCVFDFYGEIDLRSRFLVFNMGLVLAGYDSYKIYRRLKCTKEVEGIYIGSSVSLDYKICKLYSPEFRIELNNGGYYKNDTGESFSKKYIDRTFKKGKRYKVYINPGDSYDITFKRYVCLNDMSSLILGIIFIISSTIFA